MTQTAQVAQTGFENYLQEIPVEIRRAIRALGDDSRLLIVTALMKRGELSFSQLLEGIGGNSSTLTHHLRVLIEACLIRNFYAKKQGVDEYSFYDISGFGALFVKNLFHTLDVIPKAHSATKP